MSQNIDIDRFRVFCKRILIDREKTLERNTLLSLKSTVDAYSRENTTPNRDWQDLQLLLQQRIESFSAATKDGDGGISAPTTQLEVADYSSSGATATTTTVKRSPRKQSREGSVKPAAALLDAADTHSSVETASTHKLQSLLMQQKDMTAQDLDREKKQHDALTAEVAELTAVLMEATKGMQQTVAQQNMTLDQINEHAIKNKESLDSQKKKLSEREGNMQGSVLGTLGIVLWVTVWFIVTYIIIRLFPKP